MAWKLMEEEFKWIMKEVGQQKIGFLEDLEVEKEKQELTKN